MNNEQNKEFDPGDLSSTVWEAMLAPAEGATPSAETIDTAEFKSLAQDYAHYHCDYKAQSPFKAGELWKSLITHITDWHSARMAAARQEGEVYALAKYAGADVGGTQIITRLITEVNESRAALAAAREQALEEAAKHVENGSFLHDESPYAKIAREAAKAIRALKGKAAPATKPEAVAPVVRDMRAVPLVEAVRADIIGFLRASNDDDAANRVEEFMTAGQIMKNIAAPAAVPQGDKHD